MLGSAWDWLFALLPLKLQWALIGLALAAIAMVAALYYTGNL